MDPKKIFRKFYRIICYIHLFLILIYVSSVYFEYGTDTNAAVYTPIKQQLPIVSLCFDLSTLLFQNVTGKYFRSNYPSFVSLGTNSIFKKSPPVEKLLKTCSYRLFKFDTFWRNTNATECTSLFNITRYQMQGYMCYKLQFAPTKYSFYLNTNSVFDQRKLFKLEIKEPFDRGHIILPILHFSEFPYSERMINQEIIPSVKRKSSYPLSYQLYEVSKLPPPYNTKCKNGVSESECFGVCRDTEYFKLNYSHIHHILPEEQAVKDLKIVYFTKNQPEKFEVLTSIRKKCISVCQSCPCEDKLAITHISNVRFDPVLTFTIETAHSPITKLVHIPKFRFMDFCLQCFSWAGIFMSFSILDTISLPLSKCNESLATMKRKLLIVRLDINKLANSLFNKGYFRGRSTQPVARLNFSKGKIRRRLVPFLVTYTIVTFVLLLWQLSNVISNFFLFETTWKFSYEMSYELVLPNTAICLSLHDLMNVYSNDLNQSNYHSFAREVDTKLNFTLKDVFSSTPNEQVLAKCRFRDWSDYHIPMLVHKGSDCLKIFKVKRIFALNKMCYLFHPHQPPFDRSYWRLALNPINHRAIYSLMPDFGGIKNSLVQLIVYLGDGVPYWSKEHSIVASGTSFTRLQFLSYNLYRLKQLPSPYDTGCFKFIGKFACKRKCYSESLGRINRLPHGQIYVAPSDDRVLQYTDLTNQSTNDYWVALEDKCYKRCTWSACEFDYTSTQLSFEVDSGSDFKFELVLTTSQNPVTIMQAIARVTYYDLLYQVLCSLSFWVGFSFLSSHQLRLKDRTISKWTRKLMIQLHRLNYLFTVINDQKVLLKQAENRLQRGRLKETLPKLICAFGCIIHLGFSLDYFRYPTILDTIRIFDEETTYTLTLCFDPYNFFKAGLAKNALGYKTKFYMSRSALVNMTIEEMFKRTPDEKDIIALCRVWGGVNESRGANDLSSPADRLMLMETNGTRCHRYFAVDKSFIQSKICYSFTPRVKFEWNRDQLANVFDVGCSGYLFMVAVDSSLVHKRFNVLATPPNAPFRYSSIWSSYVLQRLAKFSRWHIVSYSKYIQRVLPPPYSDVGFTHMMHMKCIDSCINRPLEALNKSLTSIFHGPSSVRFITFADRVGNETFNSWLNERLQLCESKCKHARLSDFEAEMEFTVTEVTRGRMSCSSTFSGLSRSLTSFYLRRSDSPVVVIIFKAQISFFEFLITLGSIISIWFGLSVLGIPHSLLRQGRSSFEQTLHELRLKIDLLGKFIKST